MNLRIAFAPGSLKAPIAAAAFLVSLLAASGATQPTSDYVFAIGTDFSLSGTTACVDIDSLTVTTHATTVCSDAVVRCFDELLYVVNRVGCDNIQVIDPSSGFSTVREFSVGPGSNPHDIAFVSTTRAYVTRYEETWLYEVDPSIGAVTDSIDLSMFADNDGIPEMDQLAVQNGYLFVTLQRLDRDFFYTPVAPSYLVVIDPSTNTIVDTDPGTSGTQAIALTGTNPLWEILESPGQGVLYIPEAGSFGSNDGGVDVVDTSSLTALGFMTTEAQLGGDLNDVAFGPAGEGLAVIADGSFNTFCVEFDSTTGTKTKTVFSTTGFNIADIEVDKASGSLFLCDRTLANPGVRVFAASTWAQTTTSPLSVGLPPFDLVIKNLIVTESSDLPEAPRLTARHRPNPFNPSVLIEFELPAPSRATLDIYDAAGLHIRRLTESFLPAGEHRVTWNGADRAGVRVRSGVYFYRLEAADGSASGKLVLAK